MRYVLPLVVATMLVAAGCNSSNREENEVEVTLDQVPQAARDALTRESGGAQMGTVRREIEKGRPVYEATFSKGGKSWEVEVDENGKVLEREPADK
jgi:uncharacterized membrane protein YkoI